MLRSPESHSSSPVLAGLEPLPFDMAGGSQNSFVCAMRALPSHIEKTPTLFPLCRAMEWSAVTFDWAALTVELGGFAPSFASPSTSARKMVFDGLVILDSLVWSGNGDECLELKLTHKRPF